MRRQVFLAATAGWLLLAATASGKDFDHTHAAFDAILKAFVARDGVDYQGLKEHPRPLRAYIDQMNISESRFNAFTVPQKLAYWLNFYNACAMDAISRAAPPLKKNAPPPSVREFAGLWTANKWETPFGLRNLNSLEFTYLRRFGSPLWVFGVNRGARGAGAPMTEAFTDAKVEDQILQAAAAWAADPANLRADVAGKRLLASTFLRDHLPDLHDGYYRRGQFIGHAEDANIVANFFLKHAPTDKAARDLIYNNQFALVWIPCDQTLNQMPAAGAAP